MAAAGPFDDDLIAGVGQAVQGTVPQDGIVDPQPLLRTAVAGGNEAAPPVPGYDELVEIRGLLGV